MAAYFWTTSTPPMKFREVVSWDLFRWMMTGVIVVLCGVIGLSFHYGKNEIDELRSENRNLNKEIVAMRADVAKITAKLDQIVQQSTQPRPLPSR